MAPTPQDRKAERREGRIGWLIVIGLCALLILWGLANYRLVKDRPRAWDFGVLPDTPGQSAYSIATPPPNTGAQRQIAPLPEAVTGTASRAREVEP